MDCQALAECQELVWQRWESCISSQHCAHHAYEEVVLTQFGPVPGQL